MESSCQAKKRAWGAPLISPGATPAGYAKLEVAGEGRWPNNRDYEKRKRTEVQRANASDSRRRARAAWGGRAGESGHCALVNVYLCIEQGDPALGRGKEHGLHLFAVREPDAHGGAEKDRRIGRSGSRDCDFRGNGGDFPFAAERAL